MRNLRAIGFAALAFVLSLAGTANAQRVNYGSQTTASVTVFYFDLPAGTRLFLLDGISGAEIPTTLPPVSGTGSATVSYNVLPPGPGQFYVLAKNGGWVAQTVLFYLFI
jgi:sarcosine oxidase gamma subunit